MHIKEIMPSSWNSKDLFGCRFDSMCKDMNHFIRSFSRDLRGYAPAHPGWWSQYTGVAPYIDVVEDENNIVVTADLPGMVEKDIDIRFSYNVLTIKGEKQFDSEAEGKNYYRRERAYGSFQRSISIPFEIEKDKIEASFKNGVLTINLPKNPIAKEGGAKISIKTE